MPKSDARARYLLEAADESDGEGGVCSCNEDEDRGDEMNEQDLAFIDDEEEETSPKDRVVITQEEKMLDDDDLDLIQENLGLRLRPQQEKKRKRLQPCWDHDAGSECAVGSTEEIFVKRFSSDPTDAKGKSRRTVSKSLPKNSAHRRKTVDRDYSNMKFSSKEVVRQPSHPQEAIKVAEIAARAKCKAAMARMFGGRR
mmetsp:Transcript_131493/g.195914  ORF Transcript_131493/g.195914 Transcript_131493/m.195914 type:complete len:198 (-) Transcript_131493:165-758(-)